MEKNRLNYDEIILLVKDYQNGNTYALEPLLEDNKGMLINLANKYIGNGVDFEDLYSAASMGFMIGVGKFDINSGMKLMTYCTKWVEKYILEEIENNGRPIRLPGRVHEHHSKIYKNRNKYLSEFGEEPSDEELSKYMDNEFSAEQIAENDEYFKTSKCTSLNNLINNDEGTLEDIIGVCDEQYDVEKDVKEQEFVSSILDKVSDEEAQAIIDVYELRGYKERFNFYRVGKNKKAIMASEAIDKIKKLNE